MRKHWDTLLILLTFICSCSDNNPTSSSDTFSGVTMYTGGPRGGSYTNSAGKEYAYRIFRARIINDTIVPVELTINFPGDSLALSPRSDRYASIFLFPDSLTRNEQDTLYNYGIKGLESFLDSGIYKPTSSKITIQPKKDQIVYIGAMFYPSNGVARAKLFINGQDHGLSFLPVKPTTTDIRNSNKLHLVFGIGIGLPWNYSSMPCGEIVFGNKN